MNTAVAQPASLTALPLPGAFVAEKGGFFVGVVIVDDKHRAVYLAPKATEFKGPWAPKYESIPAAHPSFGLSNTMAMAAADSEIAKKVLALDVNGHKDWYIPARDELELVYRFLKPGDAENACWFRDGENANSVPAGQKYTESFPAQTTVDAFRTGAAEAMEEGWYWSSTQYSAYGAFVQDFSDGYQFNLSKDGYWRVRAVRSEVIDSPIRSFAVGAGPAVVTTPIQVIGVPAIGSPLPGGVMAGFMPADGERRAYLLVLPPLKTEKTPSLTWGPYDDEIEGLSDWDGEWNTKLLIARDEEHLAAKHCAEFEHEGFQDYYLPAKREASVMCAGARLFEPGIHWTSSQYSAYTAFVQDFSDGGQVTSLKDDGRRVRAVRRIFID